MLECLIVVLPGIITAFIHSKLRKTMNWKRLPIYIILYSVCINLIILGGLWIIGMRNFNLFDMSLRFKIKWLILGLGLGLLGLLIEYIHRTKWSLRMHVMRMMERIIPAEKIQLVIDSRVMYVMKKIFPSTLLLVVTYTVFTPNALFLNNIGEFKINYIEIIPVILCVSFMLSAVVNMVGILLFNRSSVGYYATFVFGIAICIYVQSNFLNPKLSSLQGNEIDWTYYSREGIISGCFWVLCILIVIAAFFRWKSKAEKIMKYIAYFLSAVQTATLIVLLLTTKLNNNISFVFGTEGQFTIGSEKNIVVFVIDCLQSSTMQEYLISDAYEEGQLEDFTFFDNTVSGGAGTILAMPLLVTGIEYDPLQPVDEYRKEIWEDALLYNYLHENNYDVRIYTDNDAISYIPEEVADNYMSDFKQYSIRSWYEFGSQLYKLVNFYVMPQFLKKNFWLSTTSILNTIAVNDDIYNGTNDNISFYNDMQTAGMLQADYEKSFRLYHLYGVHPPYNTNENLESVPEYSVTEQQQLQGVMKEVYTYIDYMKKAGVYDSSLIIITGDHGPMHMGENSPEANPAVLIKQPYSSHAFVYNSVPIHFRNVYATYASAVMDDYSAYGPSAFDITDKSDVERFHTLLLVPLELWKEVSWYEDRYGGGYVRMNIPADARGEIPELKIWDPYEINRISYELGEVIDYTVNNSYAEQVNYRLYKENGAATASNELSICFDIKNYSGGELQFHFSYSKVYNKEQNIRIYANGSRIATVTCSDDKKGEDCVVAIPENMIDDNTLVIRMVFPNAVTPNQIDRTDTDTRVLSVAFDYMRLE